MTAETSKNVPIASANQIKPRSPAVLAQFRSDSLVERRQTIPEQGPETVPETVGRIAFRFDSRAFASFSFRFRKFCILFVSIRDGA